jgi:hypothetical protein
MNRGQSASGSAWLGDHNGRGGGVNLCGGPKSFHQLCTQLKMQMEYNLRLSRDPNRRLWAPGIGGGGLHSNSVVADMARSRAASVEGSDGNTSKGSQGDGYHLVLHDDLL